MAIDISEYLNAIARDDDGEEVIIAIHDAALKLNTEAYKTADIETLLENIKTKVLGKDVRMDIYELLRRLSEDVPIPTGESGAYGCAIPPITAHAPSNTPYGAGIFPYRYVEYLKSTGTQYIETDIIPTYEHTKFELDMKLGSQDHENVTCQTIFGHDGSEVGYFMISVIAPTASSNTTVGFFVGFSPSYDQSPWSYWQNNVPVNNRATVVLQKGAIQWGSITTDLTPYSILHPEPSGGTVLFGRRGNASCAAYDRRDMWLYRFKVYVDNVLTNDLIPVERKSDDVLGLYDKLTNKFYTNAGTGTFEKGPYVN